MSIPADAMTSAEMLEAMTGGDLAPMLDDGASSALAAGLRYVAPTDPGLTRRRRGRGFTVLDASGRPVRDPKQLARIRQLAIPPAWRHVWICRDPAGHIQAIGKDARGRTQYRYHDRWRAVRDAANYDRLRDFYRALPRLRASIERDLSCRCACKTKVTAAAIALIDRGHLRVGNEAYTTDNGSYGATTLLCRHAHVQGDTVALDFRAKGGQRRAIRIRDRRIARVVGELRAQRGTRLFRWRDGTRLRAIQPEDVNEYLQRHAGVRCSAKVFRTWAATVAAAIALTTMAPATSITARKRAVTAVACIVAQRLGNTPAVCRKSYIHPLLFSRWLTGALDEDLARLRRSVARRSRRIEAQVIAMLA
jgi:DNA topoisomerase-1